jgi:8-amino-7-oxononanoate synthase
MKALDEYLSKKLDDRIKSGSLRVLPQQQKGIDFSSNDYLGLAKNEGLKMRIMDALHKIPSALNGSTGSRLLTGNSKLAQEIEEEMAALFKAEACLLFSSGYMANLAVFSALPQKGDTILHDELIHACVKDGSRLSFASRFPFRHNDADDLERKLKRAKSNVFVGIESVYSMDGDGAPMNDFVALCQKYGAHLIVDEAHSTGITGRYGNGLCCQLGIESDVPVRIYTFGKAMGIHGAIVVGSRKLIDFLTNFSRPFIYSTAPPPHFLISIREAFRYLAVHPELANRLNTLVGIAHDYLSELANLVDDVYYLPQPYAIQPLRIGGNARVKWISQQLQEHGMDLRPILSPTVKEGEERLRITLHQYNTEEEILQLRDLLKELLPRLPQQKN